MKHIRSGVHLKLNRVAPHAGAWIETIPYQCPILDECRSPPTRGRGLKP